MVRRAASGGGVRAGVEAADARTLSKGAGLLSLVRM